MRISRCAVGRYLTFVGDADEMTAEAEGGNDVGRRWEEGGDAKVVEVASGHCCTIVRGKA